MFKWRQRKQKKKQIKFEDWKVEGSHSGLGDAYFQDLENLLRYCLRVYNKCEQVYEGSGQFSPVVAQIEKLICWDETKQDRDVLPDWPSLTFAPPHQRLVLVTYVIYKDAKEHPDQFVLRRCFKRTNDTSNDICFEKECVVSYYLDYLHSLIPAWAVDVTVYGHESPPIYEVWA